MTLDLLQLLKCNWIIIFSDREIKRYFLDNNTRSWSREFWWTERVGLYGSTMVSEPIWIENHVRISEIAWAIRAKEVRIFHIIFIILIIQLNLNDFMLDRYCTLLTMELNIRGKRQERENLRKNMTYPLLSSE